MADTDAEYAWVPTREVKDGSRLVAAMRRWGFGDDAEAVAALNDRSVSDPEWFWREVLHDLDIVFERDFDSVLDESEGKEFPRWFTGGIVNVAELAALRHARGELAEKTAVIYEGDSGQRRSLSFAELAEQVRWFASHLSRLGVGKGDRVVLFMPVVPEAAVAYLAIAMIGAIVVPTFSGYAADALATRLQDSEAKVLITADGTTRRGKVVDLKSVADEAVAASPSVETVIVFRHLGEVELQDGRDVYWHELGEDPGPVAVAETEANDPLALVYTSGTTGRPKGIVHTHGGFAVKTAVDFAYGFDVTSDDVVSWITDLGWLVGPMLMTGPLQLGAAIVMVEGLPVHPEPNRLWEVVVRNGVTVQGIAPTAARALRSAGGDIPDMPSLKSFVSTGEAWDESTWWWLFDEVGKKRRPIINYSGGTEIGGGIIIAYSFLPSAAAGFTGALPGIQASVYDEDGRPVTERIGELVVLNTFPGMTQSFWGNRERYLDTYWRRWPGIWLHGDLASLDESGVWMIHGRSDDTLKLSGRRVGPAEIEAALLRDERITDVAVIGVPDEARGQRAVAFVVLGVDEVDPHDLQATAIVNAGKGFAPEVFAVNSLPKTKNGKIMRRIIKARFLGGNVGDTSALDPATPIEDIPALRNTGDDG